MPADPGRRCPEVVINETAQGNDLNFGVRRFDVAMAAAVLRTGGVRVVDECRQASSVPFSAIRLRPVHGPIFACAGSGVQSSWSAPRQTLLGAGLFGKRRSLIHGHHRRPNSSDLNSEMVRLVGALSARGQSPLSWGWSPSAAERTAEYRDDLFGHLIKVSEVPRAWLTPVYL